MGTKVGLTGITFGDATVQNTAPVTSAVAGSGISVSAATGAVTFTNSGVTSLVAGSGISVSGATGAVTVSSTGGGTVTSVATGNGLSGGTITGSGTLVVACPTFNTVGSYVFGVGAGNPNGTNSYQPGTNYSAGPTSNYNQVSAVGLQSQCGVGFSGFSNSLSGTWKCMGYVGDPRTYGATLFCRVS